MSKSVLQMIENCSAPKTALKDTKYSRNETILKIGHHTKGIGFAKGSFGVQHENSKTTGRNRFYKYI